MRADITNLLTSHKLRKTPIRKEVLQIFIEAGERALSNNDIEQMLNKPDRITLYRTLKTFEQKGLIHQALDGSGTTKYALCNNNCDVHEHHDEHAHFHCQSCGHTTCLEEVISPNFSVPDGYQIQVSHLILKGLCKDCSAV